jgi:hypothetical protein
MGPVAYGAERDRLNRSRGRGSWGGTPAFPASAGNGSTAGEPVLVRPRGAVSVVPVEAPIATVDDDSDEPSAPADAVPLTVAAPGAGTIQIGFEQGIALDRLLPAIESVTQAVRSRPGGLPVVINLPVAGETRQVRLPHRAEWDERLAESVRLAAGVPVEVELRAASVETSVETSPAEASPAEA